MQTLSTHARPLLLLLLLQVAPHEAARIANDGLQRLIAQKRLVLVLDLDHTLLNTGAPNIQLAVLHLGKHAVWRPPRLASLSCYHISAP
jgi:hypothetical protein